MLSKNTKTAKKLKLYKKTAKAALIIIIFIAAITTVLILSSNSVKTEAAAFHGTKCYKSITVTSGDSLWSIAGKYMDENEYTDEREYIEEVRSINHLSSDNIKSGSYLIIPYYVY